MLIILNTVGGDIEAGLAIAEMIKGLSKPSVSLVLARAFTGLPLPSLLIIASSPSLPITITPSG